MSRICFICKKGPRVVNNVSNANNRTKRWVYPNTHKIRFAFPGQTEVMREAVCTRCTKAGLVNKVV